MDSEFLHGRLPYILEGAVYTLQVGVLSLILATALGMIAALAKLYGGRGSRVLAGAYTTLIRGVPDLVLMLLVFFGGQILVNDIAYRLGHAEYIDIDAFIAGVFTLGFIFGAYLCETFRGAILAVDPGQLEAGRAYGMSGRQVFRRLLLPQMVRHAIPGFGNTWLVQLKSTALVSVIGLNDLVFRAKQAGDNEREPFTFLFVVAIIYLVLTAISELLLSWAERRASVGLRRA